jgi:ADP-ribose pyrophosphatase YjhB (NUDIX family)
MSDKEFLADRRRTQEEEYFQRQEQQLIANLHQRGSDDAARRSMAERTGILDQDVLQELSTLGYTHETVALLHLVPLLQVAWAEGGVSDRERTLIVEAARARGIESGSAADSQLATWLAERPSTEFFEQTLNAIGKILRARPLEERDTRQHDLLSYCRSIASASGGVLGFGKISLEEERALARIILEVGQNR